MRSGNVSKQLLASLVVQMLLDRAMFHAKEIIIFFIKHEKFDSFCSWILNVMVNY
jgi:hypothetical protein